MTNTNCKYYKYYIILQPSIRSMGGEEMYTRNILISAKENGYMPIVFHSGIGDAIFIKDLKTFDKYEFSEFRYEPCVVPKRKKTELLRHVKSILKELDDESIIESHEVLVAEWGEWLAQKLGIRHFAYMLLEHNALSYKPVYDFFKFKYDRKELSGITETTIPEMLANFSEVVELYSLPAYCSNVYEDIPYSKEFEVGYADFTIGSIGRTNKQCVQPIVDSIVKFVTMHHDMTFNILYVGGSMDKTSEKKVINRFSSLPNAKLFFTGMIFPISTEMVKQMDVCVSTAGSCRVSRNCGIPTISVDGNDSKAIGLYGITTRNSLFRNNDEPPIEIEELLEDVLINKKYKKEDKMEPVKVDFSSHWEFISNMTSKKEYYDIDKIVYPFKRRLISRFLGFYYGLKPSSTMSRCIAKVISFVK